MLARLYAVRERWFLSVGDALAVTAAPSANHLAVAVGGNPPEAQCDLTNLGRVEDRHCLEFFFVLLVLLGQGIEQVSVRPPTFVISCKNPEFLHFSYNRFLENRLRDSFGFKGSPIRMFYRGGN